MKKDGILDILLKEAEKSSCCKMKFGAGIWRKGRIMVLGHNEPIRTGCCLREGVTNGTYLEKCNAIHAEQVVLMKMLKIGLKPDDSLYVVGIKDGSVFNNRVFYCTFCSRLIFKSGIKSIWVYRNYKWKRLTPQEIVDESYGKNTN